MLISIIIPTFNRAATLEASLLSVLSQTYSNIEVLVVDDASTDQTINILGEINDRRLKIIRLSENSGAPNARNIGIENASGVYIAFHDSDDVWLPNKLQEQIKILKTGFSAVFCSYLRVKSNQVSIIPKLLCDQTIGLDDLLIASLIGTPTLIVERSLLERYKLRFDTNLPRFQDWDFAIKLSRYTNIGYQAKPLVVANVSEGSISLNSNNKFKALVSIYKKNAVDISNNVKLFLKWKVRIHRSIIDTKNPHQSAKYYIKEVKNIGIIEKKFLLFYTFFLEQLSFRSNVFDVD